MAVCTRLDTDDEISGLDESMGLRLIVVPAIRGEVVSFTAPVVCPGVAVVLPSVAVGTNVVGIMGERLEVGVTLAPEDVVKDDVVAS